MVIRTGFWPTGCRPEDLVGLSLHCGLKASSGLPLRVAFASLCGVGICTVWRVGGRLRRAKAAAVAVCRTVGEDCEKASVAKAVKCCRGSQLRRGEEDYERAYAAISRHVRKDSRRSNAATSSGK